jgi:hypothetical protein
MRSLGILFAASLLFAGVAYADTPGVAGSLEQSSSTSPKEKVEFGTAAVEEISSAVKTVEKLLDQAQKDKNTEAIECLTRKLTPMRALLEVSRQSFNTMQLSLAASDTVHADQEYRKVAVALTKTRDFLAEAQACVGDTGASRGDAVVTVTGEEPDQFIPAEVDVEVTLPISAF